MSENKSNSQMPVLKAGAHVHLMGICGTAMASLAGLLQAKGFKVSGSDLNPYPPMSTQLEQLGIPIQKGYKAENLNPAPDYVIVGNVISRQNDEAQALLKTNIPYTSLPKAIGEWVIGNRDSYVVAGTHGKTTTSSLLAWVTEICGMIPGFMIGGIPQNFSRSFQIPEGNCFVIEGDEYDTAFFDKVPKFIHYKPKNVILTSVEFDHADIYRDLNHVKEAFSMLTKLIPKNGILMSYAEDANIAEVIKNCQSQNMFSYGVHKGDFRLITLPSQGGYSHFNVECKGALIGTFETEMTGEYNLLNATAVIGMAYILKWNMQKVHEAVKTFKGVKRRQEILGEPGGVLVIEDFAHHPTAVEKTVKAIQDKYKGRFVWSLFEPRSATSRRKIFQKQYAQAFSVAQGVLIAKAYDQTKIEPENRFSSEELVDELKNNGNKAFVFDSSDEIVNFLSTNAKKGDVILIMSNGGFDGIYSKLIKVLEAKN